MKADGHERPLGSLRMFRRQLYQAGEVCDAVFRIDSRDPVEVDAAGVEVTGYPVAEGFAEIACFV